MTTPGALAIEGGRPVRAAMLPYGRHHVDDADVEAVVGALRSDWLTTGPAVDAAMKAKPDLNRQSTLDQLMVDIDLMDSKNSKGRVGWGAQADWDQTLAILKNYRELSTDKSWTAFHTNEFLP